MNTRLIATCLAAVSAAMLAQDASAGTLKVMLTGRANNAYFSKIIQEYQKTHKQTKITPIYMQWEDQAEAIAKKPDVFVGSRYFLSDNIDIGIFEDLNKLLPAQTVKTFLPELLYSCSLGKKIFGVPVFGYCTSLVYNKARFKEVGLQPPDTTWTWSGKFFEVCRKLSKSGGTSGTSGRYGFVGLPYDSFTSLFYSYGGSFYDKALKKVMYTEKAGMQAIDLILKLHREKVVELVDWNEIVRDDPKTYPFNNGKSAMQITWGANLEPKWYNDWLKSQKLSIEVGITPVPSGPKGPVTAVESDVVTMMTTCKNKKEAADFIKYMASAKGQEMLFDIYGALPTTTDGLRLAKVVKKIPAPFLKSYRLGRGSHIRRQAGQIPGQLWGDLRNVVEGEATMADLLQNAKDQMANLGI